MNAIVLALVALSLIAVGQTNAQNFETGDNSTVNGCSHCAYNDKDLSCWNRTLQFFEHLLLAQMRHYVAVQMNIDQWRRRAVDPYTSEFEHQKKMSIDTMKSYLQKEDVVSSETVEKVVNALMDHAKSQSNQTIYWELHFSCPLPCEYRFLMWRNLFIISSVLNVALLIVVVPFVKRITKDDANEALINSRN